jgi:hypothetical protein
MRLDFFDCMTAQEIDSVQKREPIIEGFAMQKSINILWAPAGMGKTEFMFGISKLLIEQGQEVAYIDVDNAIELLKDRGYHRFIKESNGKFRYNNSNKYDDPKAGIDTQINSIREAASNQRFDDCVFIFDSLKFFLNGDMYDEGKINRFIGFCKAIRRVGGSVWILNHATKKGDTMKGSQGLVDTCDECWQMTTLPDTETEYNYILEPEKQRMGIDKVYKVGFGMNKTTYELRRLDIEIAEMSESEKEFVDKVKSKLSNEKGLSQNELLKSLEIDRGDKTKVALLEKHAGRFWNTNIGKNRAKIYTAITLANAKSA